MVAGYNCSGPITFTSHGWLASGAFPADCIESCSASGSVDEAVEYWRNKLSFTSAIAENRDRTIAYLREFGAWTAEELHEADDDTLANRVLWLACCEISEQGEWAGLIH